MSKPKADPSVVDALVKAITAKKKPFVVGITASGSGFYGCQGRCVGRFRGRVTIPDLVQVLGSIKLPLSNHEVERVVNIEMENSAICGLSSILGYKSGTVCTIVAKRAGALQEFATPEVAKSSINLAIDVGLEALISIQ